MQMLGGLWFGPQCQIREECMVYIFMDAWQWLPAVTVAWLTIVQIVAVLAYIMLLHATALIATGPLGIADAKASMLKPLRQDDELLTGVSCCSGIASDSSSSRGISSGRKQCDCCLHQEEK